MNQQHAPDELALCGHALYVLIDPYFSEPYLPGIDPKPIQSFDALCRNRESGWQREVYVATGEHPIRDPLKLPYLVALDGHDDEWLPDLLELASGEATRAVEKGSGRFTVGAFIESDLPAERLMSRLQVMWKLRLAGEDRYLRLADPRVFEMLAHLLPPQGLRTWLGPIARWHVRSRLGTWVAHLGLADESLIEEESELYERSRRLLEFEKAPAQFPVGDYERRNRLQFGEVVSLCMTQLQQRGRLHDAEGLAAAYEAAWIGARRARDLGLRDSGDCATYAYQSIVVPGFDRSPAFASALQTAQADPGSLQSLLNDESNVASDPASGRS